jgi:hypothetical protein
MSPIPLAAPRLIASSHLEKVGRRNSYRSISLVLRTVLIRRSFRRLSILLLATGAQSSRRPVLVGEYYRTTACGQFIASAANQTSGSVAPPAPSDRWTMMTSV